MDQLAFETEYKSRPAPKIIDGPGLVTRGTAAAWATYSSCERYRYILGRLWDEDHPWLVACLLNPSTATELELDPTLRRVQGFARRDRFGGMLIVNLFAYRATNPKDMLAAVDPFGPRNDEAITAAAEQPLLARLIAGWGRPAKEVVVKRAIHVRAALPIRRTWWCWGKTKDGRFPRHPLYLKADSPLVKL